MTPKCFWNPASWGMNRTQGHLIKFSFRLYFCAPGGVIGVKGSEKLQRTWIYWFGALFFSQNWKNFKKPQNPWKNAHFLTFFRCFFNLGWKTAHQTKKFNFIEVFRFFWHPSHPQERKNSGEITVYTFVFEISWQWRHLEFFSSFSK